MHGDNYFLGKISHNVSQHHHLLRAKKFHNTISLWFLQIFYFTKCIIWDMSACPDNIQILQYIFSSWPNKECWWWIFVVVKEFYLLHLIFEYVNNNWTCYLALNFYYLFFWYNKIRKCLHCKAIASTAAVIYAIEVSPLNLDWLGSIW